MILQALRQLALAENLVEDPDFEYKPVSWRINLATDGTLVDIEDVRRDRNEGTGRKPKLEGRATVVPRQAIRTRNDAACFLVDKAEYVFGIDPTGKRAVDKLLARAALFRQQIAACHEATRDEAIGAVLSFLGTVAEDPDTVTAKFDISQTLPNDLFAFRVGLDSPLVHLGPAVKEYWKGQRKQVSAEQSGLQCLISGEPVAEVGLFPLIKRVPGGTSSGVALVSFNAKAFESYGLKGNDNAPISRTAAEEAATALNRLLDPAYPDPQNPGTALARRSVRLSADTIVCFWTTAADGSSRDFLDSLPDLLEGENEESVAPVYRSVWRGEEVELNDPAAFYALTLSGTQGRVVVRDWFETALAEAAANLTHHFRDLAVVRHARPKKGSEPPPTVPLRWLMQSLVAEGQSERVPASLEAAFVRAAFTHSPYPFQILQRALVRARVESGRSEWADLARRDARAALLKAVLNRRRRDPQIAARYSEVYRAMNPNNNSPGYNLGMLMAVLERLQLAALGDVNSSIVDRYFSAASATPRTVFVRLLRSSQHHARKAADSDQQYERAAAWRCRRLIDYLCEQFDVDVKRYPPKATGFPPHLDLEQQGLFVLGYHQMRYWL
ncbi:MAG: type I-C CRISPR-associated protein Cas8c/Csd1 [Rhodopirellula sp.]|nr:type I-C CRISPR-associated protein Cas8c/Csd1 [Rhodopirellula sp.]